jgi:hypothetical protein
MYPFFFICCSKHKNKKNKRQRSWIMDGRKMNTLHDLGKKGNWYILNTQMYMLLVPLEAVATEYLNLEEKVHQSSSVRFHHQEKNDTTDVFCSSGSWCALYPLRDVVSKDKTYQKVKQYLEHHV